MALEINIKSDKFVGFVCTHTLDLTEDFLKNFIRRNIMADIEQLKQEITYG